MLSVQHRKSHMAPDTTAAAIVVRHHIEALSDLHRQVKISHCQKLHNKALQSLPVTEHATVYQGSGQPLSQRLIGSTKKRDTHTRHNANHMIYIATAQSAPILSGTVCKLSVQRMLPEFPEQSYYETSVNAAFDAHSSTINGV